MSDKKLTCECGIPVVITDEHGSIGSGAGCTCGWGGITLELVSLLVPGDKIKWVGE